MTTFRSAGIGAVFLWFFLGGIGHFTTTAFFVAIVPPYVPHPRAVVYISGVFELLGAVGILLAGWRRWAGAGLFALTLCVTPANINMWLHPAQFSELHLGGLTLHPSPAALAWRLVLQVALLVCIYWSTMRQPARRD